MNRSSTSMIMSTVPVCSKVLNVLCASAIVLVAMPGIVIAQESARTEQTVQPNAAAEQKSSLPDPADSVANPTLPVAPVTYWAASTEQEIRTLRLGLEHSRAALERTKSLYKAGGTTQDKLDQAEDDVSQRESELASALAANVKVRTSDAFSHPIDIEAKEATVQQVAAMLSKIGGIPVKVGSSVPANLRLTIDAHDVPLATVLSSIASQANLMIAPPGNRSVGVVLTMWPQLNVNGVSKKYVGPNAPWSNEWEVSSLNQLYSGLVTQLTSPQIIDPGSGAAGFFGGAGGVSSGFLPRKPVGSPRGPIGFPGGGTAQYGVNSMSGSGYIGEAEIAPSASAVTQLGNKGIVVSESGVGPKGELGLWLTIYWLNGMKLDKGASLFHAFRSGGNSSRLSEHLGFPGGGGQPLYQNGYFTPRTPALAQPPNLTPPLLRTVLPLQPDPKER